MDIEELKKDKERIETTVKQLQAQSNQVTTSLLLNQGALAYLNEVIRRLNGKGDTDDISNTVKNKGTDTSRDRV